MKNRITLDERKRIQIEMLIEFDAFCRTNEIKYSIGYGTLLGAIRHKGYIPWDDDVDIIMPLPDIIRLKQIFKSEKLFLCDIENTPYYGYAFPRIVYKPTYYKEGITYQRYGIFLDLYPLVSLDSNEDERNKYFSVAEMLFKKRIFMMNWRERIIKRFPISTIPGYKKAVRKYVDYILTTPAYGTTGWFYNVGGPLAERDKMIYNTDLFENLIDVDFEGNRFLATSKYDYFLTKRYGDYMTPPPENQRVPYHGDYYYWR